MVSFFSGLMDYPKIIKQPMDLGTIKTRLKKNHYRTLYAVAEDVSLVWKNCMTYNADGSDFYKLAENLQNKWEDKYHRLLRDCQGATGTGGPKPPPPSSSGGSTSKEVTLLERKNFAKSLYNISKEDLGRILVEVEQKCPAAIVRNSSEDEVEFNIDKLTASLMNELVAFVQKCSAPNAGAGKKKAQAAALAAAGGGASNSNKKSKTSK